MIMCTYIAQYIDDLINLTALYSITTLADLCISKPPLLRKEYPFQWLKPLDKYTKAIHNFTVYLVMYPFYTWVRKTFKCKAPFTGGAWKIVQWSGFKPETSWLRVQSPNHYTKSPLPRHIPLKNEKLLTVKRKTSHSVCYLLLLFSKFSG